MRYAKVLILTLFIMLFTLPAMAQRAATSYYDVVVSTRTLEKGHIIVPGDVELTSTKKNDPRAVRNVEAILGMALKRTIGSKTAIKRDYLVNPSSIAQSLNRGSEVVLVFRIEGLTVTAGGRLKEKANVGDFAKIENISSGKIITGKLVDAHTAVVNF